MPIITYSIRLLNNKNGINSHEFNIHRPPACESRRLLFFIIRPPVIRCAGLAKQYYVLLQERDSRDSELVSESEESGHPFRTDALNVVTAFIKEILAAEEECQRRGKTVGGSEAEITHSA